jgi:tetratricopeptide (TPR) repeat protein
MGSGRTSVRLGSLCVLLLSLNAFVYAAPASAQDKTTQRDPSAKARAADLFQASVDSYRKGDFQTTIAQLTEAYALDPQPVLLYNLARAYEGVGNGDAAIDAYSRYLELDPKTRDRGAIEQKIATLQRERDERIALQKQSDADRQAAEAQAAEAAKQKKANDGKPAAPKPHHRSAWPYVVGGVGIAGIATGAVFGLIATSEHSTATKDGVQQTASDDQKKAQTFATVSTVTLIGGGVLLAAGLTWWILDGGSDGKPATATGHARLGVTPRGLIIEGTFE